MPEALGVDPKHTAVVVLDYQVGVVAMLRDGESLLARAASVLDGARGARVPVIYVVVEFRPGHPEIHPRNVALAARIKDGGRLVTGSPETRIAPALAPLERDLVVVKRRMGAFSGTELDPLLRAMDVTSLIVFGIATSGAVLTTVRQAFDLDYSLCVVADCCADFDPDLHATLMDKVIGRQARLESAEGIRAELDAARASGGP